MKKPVVVALTAQLLLLFALPGVTWLVGSLDLYLAIPVLILLAVHPLCCLGTGIFAGLDIKARWWLLPAVAVLVFYVYLVLFSLETAFLLFAGADLLLGALGITGAALVQRIRKR